MNERLKQVLAKLPCKLAPIHFGNSFRLVPGSEQCTGTRESAKLSRLAPTELFGRRWDRDEIIWGVCVRCDVLGNFLKENDFKLGDIPQARIIK